uniref:Tensin-like C1 domain-containing phosphatase n=1 Tax=Callorhinchus milii TaxID=7868 RepID=A0A4W3GMX8_CALMI
EGVGGGDRKQGSKRKVFFNNSQSYSVCSRETCPRFRFPALPGIEPRFPLALRGEGSNPGSGELRETIKYFALCLSPARALVLSACNVLYVNSVETESLTGPQAIAKATVQTFASIPLSTAIVVHFKVSLQGITLTDSQRKIFFRRHYPVSTVTFCSLDPQDRRWTNPDSTTSK